MTHHSTLWQSSFQQFKKKLKKKWQKIGNAGLLYNMVVFVVEFLNHINHITPTLAGRNK